MWLPIAILWRVYREYILDTMDPQSMRNDVESSYHALQRLTLKGWINDDHIPVLCPE